MKCGFVAPAVALLFAASVFAQGESTHEPEYFSVFYYLQTPAQFIELERQTPTITRKGSKLVYAIPGEKSPVRFNANSKVQFIVRVMEDLDRARATMQLLRFESGDGKRQLLVKELGSGLKAAGLKLNAERYASSSLKLSPVQELAPGEYCLSRTTIAQGFCFGIDAAGKVGP